MGSRGTLRGSLVPVVLGTFMRLVVCHLSLSYFIGIALSHQNTMKLIIASVCVNGDVINHDHVTVGLSVQQLQIEIY